MICFKKYCEQKNITIAKLSEILEIPSSTFRRKMKEPDTFTVKELKKISEKTGLNFYQIIYDESKFKTLRRILK